MREHILNEIRRLAAANGGRPPGKRAFESEAGIRESEWYGVYWARWSEALAEAGFSANEMKPRFEQNFLLEKLAHACRHYGKVPTFAELRLYRRQVDPEFPSVVGQGRSFDRAEMIEQLRKWISDKDDYADLAAMIPAIEIIPEPSERVAASQEGLVYLLRSGSHYKIGRSDQLERRVKEITVALPEAVKMVHAIRTDDPAGIEAYWHRRFADRRANGEWFKLTPGDVVAFKRRKYQ